MTHPIGILGGTFDPPHRAHLALARAALERLGLSRVVWIPAGWPPHRALPQASAEDRLAMVRLAIADEPRFRLDDSEAKNASTSFTVNTLERLRKQLGPDRPLVLLMGADAFHGLPSWHRWEDILRLAHIAVATRPGYPLTKLTGALADLFGRCRLASADFSHRPAGGIHAFELSAGTVSATEVRALVAAGASDAKLLELLPPAVLDYIRRHRLYRR
ncbi:MAG: nicotinate-nucleotide adenylyltransferase [Rhodocyclaceae bacterium]